MASAERPTFTRRSNPDGTVDLICGKCYMTIATSKWSVELDRAEKTHVCDARDLDYWKTSAKRPRNS